MKKLIITMMVAVLAGAVFAKPGAEGKGMKPRRGGHDGAQMTDAIVRLVQNPKMAGILNLTQEQKDKLAEVNKISSEEIPNLHKKVRESMKNQKKLLKATPVDESAVMASVDEVFESRKSIAKIQMKKLIAIQTILTPDQIEKARSAMKQMRKKKGGAKAGSEASDQESEN